MKVALSIIIPVYNAERYIIETLSSINYQVVNARNISVEVIIVNDGSTDNSKCLINNYISTNACSHYIKLLDQSNQGVSVARNNGIKASKGEYVAFVDSDDLMLEGYIHEVFGVINSVKPDVIEFGFYKFKEELDVSKNNAFFTHNNFGALNKIEVINDIYGNSHFYPFLRIIKREFFLGTEFSAGVKFCEDMIFLHSIYSRIETIYHIDKPLIGYRDNVHGATRNIKEEYIPPMLNFYSYLEKEKGLHIELLKANVFYTIYSCTLNMKTSYSIPLNLVFNVKILLVKVLFSPYLSAKKKAILLSPMFSRSFSRLKTFLKS
ncbi:glycosyltransferase [Vibrio fluvialis]|nr:glycosyltransferase [Vibrio fluvialis]